MSSAVALHRSFVAARGALLAACLAVAPVSAVGTPGLQDPETQDDETQDVGDRDTGDRDTGDQDRPGAPPADLIVREIVVENLLSYNEEGVLRALGIEVGKPFRHLRSGMLRVWQNYHIIVTEPVLEAVPGGVRVIIRVTELAVDLAPRFVGNQKIKEKKLREWALLGEHEQVYLHAADGVRTRMIKGYMRQGFHFVEIDKVYGGATEAGGVANDVIFEIREGPKVRVTSIKLRGNRQLPDTGWGFWRSGLRSHAKVQIKGRGIFRWWGSVFDMEELQADLLAMRQVYRNRGYLDAKVEIEELVFNDARSRVAVYIMVDEGPLYRVQSVDVVAIEIDGQTEKEVPLLYPKQELLDELNLQPGLPFERARVLRDERALRNYYGSRGHLQERRFSKRGSGGWEFLDPPDVVYDFERKEVQVIYRIIQGRQRFVREVFITGNAHTKDKVIRREIEVLEGDRADIINISRSLARIRGTQYFDDPMDIRHLAPTFTFHEVEGDPDLIDIEYHVNEGRVVNLNLSGGVASDSGLMGLLSLNMRNFAASNLPTGLLSTFGEVFRKEAFHGNGETLGIDISPGSQISYWRILYAHGDIFNSHYNRVGFSTELKNRERRYRSHDEERRSARLTFSRLFGLGDFSIRFGPVFQNTEVDDLDADEQLPQTLIDSEGDSDYIGLTFDMRYRRLDNRMSPQSGISTRWANTLFGGPFGGDNDIWKSEVFLDYYFQLGNPDKDVRPGVYIGGAVGIADPFDEPDFVNYSERYFLGGSNTLRGFDFRGVGPNDGDFAVGGETYARLTLEYRHPLYSTVIPGTSRRQEMFRMILFADAGVLDPDAWNLDLDEYRASVGVGFGLIHPIPISFNFGFPIQEGPGDDTQVFSFRLSLY